MTRLFTIILAIISTVTYGQLLSLDQAIALRPKSIAILEETLTTKKWSLLAVNDPTDEQRGSIDFALEKSSFDDSARAFLSVYYQEMLPNRMVVQINRPADYTVYLNRLKQLGFKLDHSKIESGSIRKVYKTKNLVIKIITSTTKEEYSTVTKTYHTFGIYDREDFEDNLED